MIIKCQCCCSALEVEWDEELQTYNFALWERHSINTPFSFKERLRWCWHVLRTGDPWSDHVIVSKEDFDKLIRIRKNDT